MMYGLDFAPWVSLVEVVFGGVPLEEVIVQKKVVSRRI